MKVDNLSIPLPLQIVIDDVGWRRGRDDAAVNGPYRTGIARLHEAEDYLAIAMLGRQLNMRPQAAMILGEWDRSHLRDLPTAAPAGVPWDDADLRGTWREEATTILRGHAGHIELTLHGLGHEYWEDGIMSRAEWHGDKGRMRPQPEVTARLQRFLELMEEFELPGPPRSFVPCAFRHRFAGPEGGMAACLRAIGITSLSTPFAKMHRSRAPEHALFGFDQGLITIDRGRDGCAWNRLHPNPRTPPSGPICGMHWPNVLHDDPQHNAQAVQRWVNLLAPLEARPERTLSRDTDAFAVQLVHHAWTRVNAEGERITVDARRFFAAPWADRPDKPLILKHQGPVPLHLKRPDGRVHRAQSITPTCHRLAIDIGPHEPVLTLQRVTPT